jgi:hypothetical protein
LHVAKHTDPGGAADAPFVVSTAARPDIAFTLDDNEVRVLTDLPPGRYAVDEIVPVGWHLADHECSGVSTEPGSDGGIIVNIAPGAVATCIFSNVQLATISATKHVEPPGVAVPPGGFGFDITGDDLPDAFVGDGEFRQRTDLLPGTYTVDEVVPAGWSARVVCTGSGHAQTDNLRGSAVITVTAGQHEECQWINTKLGEITIIKDSRPSDAQDVTFGIAYNRVASIPFMLDDDGDPTDDVPNGLLPDRVTARGLLPGLYTISEQVMPTGWSLNDVSCVGANASSVITAAGSLFVRLSGAESLECTFVNSLQTATTTSPSTSTPTTSTASTSGPLSPTTSTASTSGPLSPTTTSASGGDDATLPPTGPKSPSALAIGLAGVTIGAVALTLARRGRHRSRVRRMP